MPKIPPTAELAEKLSEIEARNRRFSLAHNSLGNLAINR
jgi:hypothetical protein